LIVVFEVRCSNYADHVPLGQSVFGSELADGLRSVVGKDFCVAQRQQSTLRFWQLEVILTYWCASSVAGERLPSWSRRRAGELGGVRFKRIVLDPDRWMELQSDADPVAAAEWVRKHEGALYDWRLILGFIA
jgi:hypothetical protein